MHHYLHRPSTRRRRAVLASLLACSTPFVPGMLRAQDTSSLATVHVVVRSASVALSDALVTAGGARARTDTLGRATLMVPVPMRDVTIAVRRIGFRADSVRVSRVAGADTSIVITLLAQAATIAPVIVSSTRTERRVEDEPLRIEVLAGEDVGEKAQMHPAGLRVLLTEMSGVRVQTTSPSLGGAAVRIQGLRGHDTQLLTDGLPLYGAQAGSFGLLQIPPLDLRQAEVVKGSASALYGPNALGGVLNLISRRPSDSSEVLANSTVRGGADLVAFGARGSSRTGATLLVGAHLQR